MPATDAKWMALVPHPDTPADAIAGIAVEVQRADPATLLMSYTLYGDISRLRIPGKRVGRRSDGLWEHTCFEAFVAAEQELPAYYEFNFSPVLDWAAYRFADYREAVTLAPLTQSPGLQVHRTPDRFELQARVHLAGLPALIEAQSMRLALTAVIEHDSGQRSYWALQHAPGDPDFHHADGFMLELSDL
jgi:hypothetical protein